MSESERDQSIQFSIDHPVGVVDVTIYEVLADGKGIRTLGLASFPLANLPDIADELMAFIADAELVIHNAAFDLAFLDAELARTAGPARTVASVAQVLDTLTLARQMHPGQRNSLDALCKRYGVDNSNRELHGALLDARLRADVYLAMTGGQAALALDERGTAARDSLGGAAARAPMRTGAPLLIIMATPTELLAHEALVALIAKTSGHCAWPATDAHLSLTEARTGSVG